MQLYRASASMLALAATLMLPVYAAVAQNMPPRSHSGALGRGSAPSDALSDHASPDTGSTGTWHAWSGDGGNGSAKDVGAKPHESNASSKN